METYGRLSKVPIDPLPLFIRRAACRIPLQRYIHQNPLKEGLVAKLEDYAISSYCDFIRGGGLTDTEFSLALLGRDEWIRLHEVAGEEVLRFLAGLV